MRIYLVRHGQSTHNANLDIPHNPDPPLTSLGHEQAVITGQALSDAGLNAAMLYCSPQRRALETADALRRSLRLTPHVLPNICETGGLREHSGMTRSDILKEWPGVTLDTGITDSGWWTGGLSDEEEAAFYSRAAHARDELMRVHSSSGDTIIVVSHGRFGSALVSTILGLAPAGYSRYPFDNCAITRIDFDPHTAVAYAPPPGLSAADESHIAVRLMFHNQYTHLPPSHRT